MGVEKNKRSKTETTGLWNPALHTVDNWKIGMYWKKLKLYKEQS
jgi:hypothetical protein